MSTSKPHIVFLHGGWHSPIYFSKVTSLLQDHLYVVHAEQLPATGLPPSWTPPSDLSLDIAATRTLLDYAIADGNDVVVICHSWGGTIAGSALVGYSKEDRAEKGLKGGVVKCGYMAAFMVDDGVSLQGKVGEYPPWYNVDVRLVSFFPDEGLLDVTQDPYVNPNDPDIFYNDLPKDEQAYWFSQLKTHSLATLQSPTTGASWKTIPSSYLFCEQDRALPPSVQEILIDEAKEKGASIDVVRIDAGHSPFLSKPKETVDWIRGVAGEKV